MHLHHGPQGGHPQANGHMPMQAHHKITPAHLSSLNESVWLMIGKPFHPNLDWREKLLTGRL